MKMKFESIEKLVKGQKYEIKVVEQVEFELEGKQADYVAEYRGEDREPDYLLFQVEGEKLVTEIHFEDILKIKKI